MITVEEILAVLTQPAWKAVPAERDLRYFQTWQRVSVALQKGLRTWIPALYFRDALERYEERAEAYQLVVYEACRACHGRPRTEFTYDIADAATLPAAYRGIGRTLQTVLDRVSKQLREAGRPEIARRYAPVWHQDILAAAQKKPKPLLGLLASEASLINGVIDLGTTRDARAAIRFSRTATLALRAVFGTDMRVLARRALEETTRLLLLNSATMNQAAGGIEDVVHNGIFENHDTRSHTIALAVPLARSPNPGIGREKDSNHWNAGGGGEMCDAGIVTDIQASLGKPAG